MTDELVNIDKLIDELSLAEKCLLLSGTGRCETRGFEKHGIPKLMMSDGPHGIRTEKFFNKDPADCLPSGTGMGATFDTELMHRVGNLLADEAKAHLVHMVLAPVVCLQRSALIGRGFEAFGEDPVQSGKLGGAYVNGLQERGVASCIKHYAAHDQSDNSIEDNVIMTQRTLREAFMSGYHKLNGIHCSESPELIKDILRDDWKYDGLVLSDWWGVYSTSEAINAGLDLEMPGPPDWRANLLDMAVRSRKVSMETLNSSVRRVLELVNRVGPILSLQGEQDNNTPESRELVRKLTADGLVLLKNDANVLPLRKDVRKRYGLIGDHWKRPAVAGGGSSEVEPYYISKGYGAMVEAVGEGNIDYELGCYSHKFAPLFTEDLFQPDSQEQGILLEFYHKNPEEESDAKLWHVVGARKTELNLADSLPRGSIPDLFFLKMRGIYRTQKSMNFRIGLSCAGRARLFVNGKKVIDLWASQPEKTDSTPVFNCFTMEGRADISMEQGKEHEIVIHLDNSSLKPTVGVAPAGGVRVGGFEVLDQEETMNKAVTLAKKVDVPIVYTGLGPDYEYEGVDRKTLDLPGRVDELIKRVCEANPNTVVVTEAGTAIAMPWVDDVKTLLHGWLGAQETGHAIVDALFGDVNSSGRLPLTFPKRIEDTAAFLSFRKADRTIVYGENVFIGYRFHEMTKRDPLFYFGHGLSYTKFDYSNLVVPKTFEVDEKHTMSIKFDLANVGDVAGSEVVQVYIADLESTLQRPKKEFKAFKKVSLQAGENKTIEIELDKYALSVWSEEYGKWLAEAGTFAVIISRSAAPEAEVLRETFDLPKTFKWTGLRETAVTT
ncbi:hypothetical protein MRS44_013462 [Fusarium solani]|uniref:uncharacterized protein n=1 Tax=Fusarium solani TaxID=169388 RepID=UPI0032C47A55|nr:hypothetical protein MRS44_013462 [Fusarium solani]